MTRRATRPQSPTPTPRPWHRSRRRRRLRLVGGGLDARLVAPAVCRSLQTISSSSSSNKSQGPRVLRADGWSDVTAGLYSTPAARKHQPERSQSQSPSTTRPRNVATERCSRVRHLATSTTSSTHRCHLQVHVLCGDRARRPWLRARPPQCLLPGSRGSRQVIGRRANRSRRI